MLLEAFGFGLIAQSSLFLAGLAVCWITVPTRVIGILAGFGAGALIAAIAFELVPEGQTNISGAEFALWTLLGVSDLPRSATRWSRSASARKEPVRRWGSWSARSSTASPNRSSSASRSGGPHGEPEFHGGGIRVEHPAGHRPVG